MAPKHKSYNVSYYNYKTASLDDYYEDFAKIWSRDFSERSSFDLWLHIVDHASRVAKAIRKQQPHKVIDDIADTTVWLFSFLSHCAYSNNKIDMMFKTNFSPSKIIWMKYPGICPSCFDFSFVDEYTKLTQSDTIDATSPITLNLIESKARTYTKPEHCSCLSRTGNYIKTKGIISRQRSELDKIRYKYAEELASLKKEIVNINGLQEMFRHIYCNIYEVISLETIAFHLLEEVGETTQAIKDLYTYDNGREPFTPMLDKVRKSRMYDKIADIFSWLFTLALKIDSTYVNEAFKYYESISKNNNANPYFKPVTFAEIIWAKYGQSESGGNWESLKCPGCQCAPCECERDLKVNWQELKERRDSISLDGKECYTADEKSLIFISYSHKDAVWLDRFNTMLKPLLRNKTISAWNDKHIGAGQLWRNEIDSALIRAKIAVLLVSDNFLASDFIADNELIPILKGAEGKETKIVWIPVSACLYTETDIAKYQAASNPENPLDSLLESECKKVLAGICKYIKELST